MQWQSKATHVFKEAERSTPAPDTSWPEILNKDKLKAGRIMLFTLWHPKERGQEWSLASHRNAEKNCVLHTKQPIKATRLQVSGASTTQLSNMELTDKNAK